MAEQSLQEVRPAVGKIRSVVREMAAGVRRRATTLDTDIIVYGASTLGAVGGFVIEARGWGEGAGIILALGSMFAAGTRMVLKRMPGAAAQDLPSIPADLTPFGERLWSDETKRARRELRAIEEGELVVRNPDLLGIYLQLMTTMATGSVSAVDDVDLGTWMTNQAWIDYRKIQMQRCRDGLIQLTRIRRVSKEEINDRDQRLLLSAFIDEHETSRATILLCPESALERLENVWSFRSDGCLLANVEGSPACIIGPNVYVKDSAVVQTCRADFETLKRYIIEEGLDAEVRRDLFEALAEDFDDDTPEND